MDAQPLTSTHPPLRCHDWAERLVDVIARHHAPFAWGTCDCATLFAGAVEAVTGADPLAPFRPWGSEADAMRRLAASGHRSVIAFTEAHFPEIEPADVRRGDLIYGDAADALSCPAVVIGSAAMSLTPCGAVLFPITLARRAFMVGR